MKIFPFIAKIEMLFEIALKLPLQGLSLFSLTVVALTYQQMSPPPPQNCVGISNKKQLEIMVARVIRKMELLLSNCTKAQGKIKPRTRLSLYVIPFPSV